MKTPVINLAEYHYGESVKKELRKAAAARIEKKMKRSAN
jgi:hypothetical protein